MKLIIAGSRTITDAAALMDALSACPWSTPSEIVSGGARGVDELGELLAGKLLIPVARFPADWNTHGKAAGFIRNRQMAKYADALLAVWDGTSRGTLNMIQEATKAGIPAFVWPSTAASEAMGLLVHKSDESV